MEIVLYVLGVIGFTHIMADSKVMQPIRDWLAEPYWPSVRYFFKSLFTQPIIWTRTYVIANISQIISCYQCCGFWCGLFVGWSVFPTASWLQVLSAGFAGSFLANSAAIFMNYLEAQTIVHLHDENQDKGTNG